MTQSAANRSDKESSMTDRPNRPDADDGADANARVLPLVALRETVIFPEMIVPLQVGRDKSVQALNRAVADNSLIALVTQRQAEKEAISRPKELHEIGTL